MHIDPSRACEGNRVACAADVTLFLFSSHLIPMTTCISSNFLLRLAAITYKFYFTGKTL